MEANNNMAHFGRPNQPPVRAFDGTMSVMTQNRQVKEAGTINLHSKVKNEKRPQRKETRS